MVDRFEQELGSKATVVATGGIASKIIPYCKHHVVYDENLLLRGLGIIYKKNKR
jgi:type III pantothenate kinase